MKKKSKIYIAGISGMVGSSIKRKLVSKGFLNIIGKSSNDLDLTCQVDVNDFFKNEKPDYVILAAAKVGGIYANDKFKAEFIYDNLMIESNIIHASYLYKVKKLLFLGSSCIYPKLASQPIKEEYLLSDYLEPTNKPYAIAKIAGIELCESYRYQYGCNFITAMPTNLYGQNDNYHPKNSHVIPALIRKFVEAKNKSLKEVVVWGTGKPKREFLHVDDLADACYHLLINYNESGIINVGTGKDVTISELSQIIKKIVGYKGKIKFDSSKPDGTLRKVLDVSRINKIGWKSKIELKDGLLRTIEDFKFFYN